MSKFMRSMSARILFLTLCLCVLPATALAVSCPASLSVTLNPANTNLLQSHSAGLTAASITPGNADVVCSYTTHLLLLNYSPRVLSAATKAACDQAGNNANPATCSVCPPFKATATIPSSTPAPPTGFSPWAFGSPGTSASDAFTPGFSGGVIRPSPKSPVPPEASVAPNCKIPGNGVVAFAIYSGIPSGYSCTATGTTVTCTPPPPPICPATLKGSNIPTPVWTGPSIKFGYIAADTGILHTGNPTMIQFPASLSTIKGAIGTAYNNSIFTLTPGVGPITTLGAGFVGCQYNSPDFQFHNQSAQAQLVIACSMSCGSL